MTFPGQTMSSFPKLNLTLNNLTVPSGLVAGHRLCTLLSLFLSLTLSLSLSLSLSPSVVSLFANLSFPYLSKHTLATSKSDTNVEEIGNELGDPADHVSCVVWYFHTFFSHSLATELLWLRSHLSGHEPHSDIV